MSADITTKTLRDIIDSGQFPTCITQPSGIDYTPIRTHTGAMVLTNVGIYHTPGMGTVAEITGNSNGRYIHLASVPLDTEIEIHDVTAPMPFWD